MVGFLGGTLSKINQSKATKASSPLFLFLF
jgi:hypothetical protein